MNVSYILFSAMNNFFVFILSNAVRVVYLLMCFMFLVLCCDVCYDFRIQTIVQLVFAPVVCRRVHF